jgi:lactose/L-arabinose transport system ATP-binding protein
VYWSVLRSGAVEQVGSPLELYDNPANLFVAGFIGSPKMNFFRAVVENTRKGRRVVRLPDFGTAEILVSLHRTTVAAGINVSVGIRPEHFNESGSTCLDVTIDLLEHLGGETFAYVRHGASDLVIIETKNGRNLKSGQRLEARFDPASSLLFDGSGQRIY